MQKQDHRCFIFIMGMLAMLPPLAIDMYLPAFLEIARELRVSQERLQATLAIFTFGFAIGQLFWGPVADSFGRKPIIFLGLLGSAIAALGLTQVAYIESFYWLRLVQGLFAAAPAVVLGALVRDLFARERFAQVMSAIMMITMLAPLVAPIIGGYLVTWWHWHAIFYALLIMGLLCVALIGLKVPETLPMEKRLPLSFVGVLKNFAALLSHLPTLGYVLVGSLSFAGMFCFLTAGSLVYIGLYGISVEHFGYFFIMNIAVMMLMTWLNGKLIPKLGSETMLRVGLGIQLLAGMWLAGCAWLDLGFWAMAFGIPFFVGVLSTIGSNASAAILDRHPQMAGTANALAGTARFGIGSVVGGLLSLVSLHSASPMLYAMALCTLVASASYYLFCCRAKRQ